MKDDRIDLLKIMIRDEIDKLDKLNHDPALSPEEHSRIAVKSTAYLEIAEFICHVNEYYYNNQRGKYV